MAKLLQDEKTDLSLTIQYCGGAIGEIVDIVVLIGEANRYHQIILRS